MNTIKNIAIKPVLARAALVFGMFFGVVPAMAGIPI
jgi:hypothetical protein